MPKYTFATQKGKAYYWNTIPGFLKEESSSIIGQLVRAAFELGKEQSDAWDNQIKELQSRLSKCEMVGDIIFEYDIVRLGKRIDVVLLIRHMVFSLEFKNGVSVYTAKDARQAEDYAIDIKNFHKASEDLYVCPILIATDAKKYHKQQSIGCYPDKQIYLQRENIETFVPKVQEISNKYGDDRTIDFNKWFYSPYHPTPTIIAAAVEAYTSHDVSEIAKSEAGQDNIDACEKEINKIIDYAKTHNRKCVCFVTGVPGAGKTLVGLDVVAKNLDKDKNNLSVYLSGNGPLVKVLRAALKKSAKEMHIVGKDTDEAVNALIQGSYGFKRDNAPKSTPTAEHILIFDEAQRVWDADMMKSKHEEEYMAMSEPSLLYQIMNRHQDWAVMICLVGLGQDIYDGEVGISEWFRCGIEEYTDWEMFYSRGIFSQSEDKGIEKEKIEKCPRCHEINALHLKTSIRSFRADKQCQFVDYLLDNKPELAGNVLKLISEKYPVYLTRDIKTAKSWAKSQIRGSQRCGVLACSSAQRLKPEGIYVPKEIDEVNWFLAPAEDLRSSNMMEIVASEFKIQGLELDWAVVCWDLDLRRKDNQDWEYYNFRGTKWVMRHNPAQQRYLLNSYRVLLTRARQGMVIFVPYGVNEEEDPTRKKEFYDKTYEYLLSCGIKELVLDS